MGVFFSSGGCGSTDRNGAVDMTMGPLVVSGHDVYVAAADGAVATAPPHVVNLDIRVGSACFFQVNKTNIQVREECTY